VSTRSGKPRDPAGQAYVHPSTQLEGRFYAPMTREFLQTQGLSSVGQVRVWAEIYLQTMNRPDWYRSYSKLAGDVGMSRAAVIRAVAQLQRAGLVSVHHRRSAAGDDAENIFRAHMPPAADARDDTTSGRVDDTTGSRADATQSKTPRTKTPEEHSGLRGTRAAVDVEEVLDAIHAPLTAKQRNEIVSKVSHMIRSNEDFTGWSTNGIDGWPPSDVEIQDELGVRLVEVLEEVGEHLECRVFPDEQAREPAGIIIGLAARRLRDGYLPDAWNPDGTSGLLSEDQPPTYVGDIHISNTSDRQRRTSA